MTPYADQNADERISDAEQREQERCDALDLEQQLADESRDNPPLTESEFTTAGRQPEVDVGAALDKLGATALRIKRERDDLADALRDIAFGAEMMLQPPFPRDSAFSGYAREVKRVALAALAGVIQ